MFVCLWAWHRPGFSVVADEVRKLAELSSKSASEIDLVTLALAKKSAAVEQSIEKGHQSIKTIDESRKRMRTVLTQTFSLAAASDDGVDTITLAVNEQKAVAEQIAKNIEHIAQMIEANYSSIAETSQAAQQLRTLAADTEAAVGWFKI